MNSEQLCVKVAQTISWCDLQLQQVTVSQCAAPGVQTQLHLQSGKCDSFNSKISYTGVTDLLYRDKRIQNKFLNKTTDVRSQVKYSIKK